jgi:Uma2 family endonuclease
MFADPQSDEMYGIPITEDAFERVVSIRNPYRYEMMDEVLYDVTESSPEHNGMVENIFNFIHAHLAAKDRSYNVYQDRYVAIPFKPSVMPDVVVTSDCVDRDEADRVDRDEDEEPEIPKIQAPYIVFEVLSPRTHNYDRIEKFARYLRCSSLEAYIMVSYDEPFVEVYRRATGWRQERFTAGQAIKLDPIDLELPVDTIYKGISLP